MRGQSTDKICRADTIQKTDPSVRKKKKSCTEEPLGFAVGAMGMGFDDFFRLTFPEFRAACSSYREAEERKERSEWERARTLSFHFLQPYLKRECSSEELMPLPWDRNRKEKEKHVSRDEAKRRFEKRAGK